MRYNNDITNYAYNCYLKNNQQTLIKNKILKHYIYGSISGQKYIYIPKKVDEERIKENSGVIIIFFLIKQEGKSLTKKEIIETDTLTFSPSTNYIWTYYTYSISTKQNQRERERE